MTTRALFATAALVLASGCQMSAPTDAASMRAAAASSRFAATQSFTSGRSLAQVNASLQAGAGKCLNRTTENVEHMMPAGGMGGSYGRTVIRYSTSFKTTATGGQLDIRQEMLAGGPVFGPKGANLMFVVETAPSSAGTSVLVSGPSMSYKDVPRAIREWAATGALRCPELL